MSRSRPDLKAGDVLSFRIPENVSLEDLNHLRRIAKRSTSGKTGAINAFFFSKVNEDRIQQSRHISVELPGLSDEQIALLDSPVFKNALTIYAYQILKLKTTDIETMTLMLNRNEMIEKESVSQAQIPQEKRADPVDGPDPRALDLMRKLQG